LAGSLLAPLRCAGPCQFQCRATWPPSRYPSPSRKLPSHLPFGRAIYLRPAELHALGDSALETRFYPLSDHGPVKFSEGAGLWEKELAHRGCCVDGLLVNPRCDTCGKAVSPVENHVADGENTAFGKE